MSTPWYYVVAGERKGPVEEEQLRELLRAGTVTAESLVWTPGMAQWLPARACPALAGQLGGTQPPAAVPSLPAAASDDGVISTLIPYRNVPALVAYYCGVFALIPCFPIGIAGLVLGIIGLRVAKRNPAARGKVHAWVGIIAGGLFGIGWLVLTIVGIIAAAKGGRGGW